MNGQELRRLRRAAHVRQTELAKAIGATGALVCMYEAGIRRIPSWREPHLRAAIDRLAAARRYANSILLSAISESRQAGRLGA